MAWRPGVSFKRRQIILLLQITESISQRWIFSCFMPTQGTSQCQNNDVVCMIAAPMELVPGDPLSALKLPWTGGWSIASSDWCHDFTK